MSKTLGYIQGKYEYVSPDKTILLTDSVLVVTSFYGGADRGQCIQLTPSVGSEYIQLTRENVSALVGILNKWELEQTKNELRPWELEGITELQYYKRALLKLQLEIARLVNEKGKV